MARTNAITITSKQIQTALARVTETTGQSVARWHIQVHIGLEEIEEKLRHSYWLTAILANGEEFVVDDIDK